MGYYLVICGIVLFISAIIDERLNTAQRRKVKKRKRNEYKKTKFNKRK